MLRAGGWKGSALPQTYLALVLIPASAASAPTIKNVFLIKLHNTQRIYHRHSVRSCTELWICSLVPLSMKVDRFADSPEGKTRHCVCFYCSLLIFPYVL